MKKYSLKLLILLLICSCSKDDDSSNSPVQAELSGSWKVASYDFVANTTIVEVDDIYFTNFTDFYGTAGTMDLIMVFNDSGGYTFNGYYYLYNEVYPNLGQAYAFTDYHTVEEEGSWSINGNKVNVLIGGEERTIGISELTDTRLVLRINTGTSSVNEQQTTTTTNKQETFVLQRQ